MNRKDYEELIESVPNFPKEGVVFKDVSPLLQLKFDEVISDMGKNINWENIDVILGIESRGFILGAAMAQKFNKGFIPIRKKGKLPPPIISETYALEYGVDTLEMKMNAHPLKVLIVDDVLATGGTLRAAMSLCERNHMKLEAISVLINLTFLNKLNDLFPIQAVLEYD